MPRRGKLFIITLLLTFVTASLSAQKRIDGYDPEAVFQEAKTLFDNQNYSSAAELFNRYLSICDGQSEQKMVEARFYEAACSSYMGAGEEQLMLFSKENPTSTLAPKADLLYANTLFKNRKYRDALKKYEVINEDALSKEDRAEFYFKKGLAYYQTNDIDKAAPLFYKAVFMESPYGDDARYYYAHIQYVNKKYDEAKFHFKKIESSPKYKDVVPLYLMQIDFVEANYATVTQYADTVLAAADKTRKAELALIVAESWYEQQNYAKALEYYTVAQENSKRPFAREVEFQIGFCKMKQGDYEGAITNFQNATKKRNDDELAQYASYYLAQCYSQTGQDKFARNAYLVAHKTDFDHEMSEDALFNYAMLSFISGVDPFNEAVAQLDEYIGKHPDSPRRDEARLLVIHLYLNNKDYNKAIRALEKYPDLNDEMQAIYARLTYDIGIQDYNASDYDGAVSYLTKTVNNKKTPATVKAEAYYWLADSYMQKKDNGNAERFFGAFLKSEGSGQTDLMPLAHYNLGYLAYAKGNFANATKEFNYFINMTNGDKPYESDAWMRIGDSYFMERNYQKAINAYGNAMKLDQRNADYALFQQGMGHGAMGNMNAKVNSLDRLVKDYSTSSFYDRAIYEIGMAHLSTKDQRSAIAAFSKLVKDRPRSAYARQGQMKIGMLYYNDNQYDNALAALQKVVKDYPNTEEAREALNIMRNIYMEQNNTSEFYAFTGANGIATSVTEQDSVSFATAENFFQQGQYENAVSAVDQYIQKFPQGAYMLKINYYGQVSLEKLGRQSETKPYLEYIISQPDNDYTDNALLKLAAMEKTAGDFAKAKAYYQRLRQITENQKLKMQAIEGVMECSYKLDDYDAAIGCGNELLAMTELSKDKKNQANYYVGMSLYKKDDYRGALSKLEACSQKDRGAMGAEAAYYVVLTKYNLGNLDEAEESVFYISDNFSSFSYYVAMSFVTLSDVYVAKDNVFQAKETLKSIIDNYPGGEPKELAQQKLAAIEKEELKSEEDAE